MYFHFRKMCSAALFLCLLILSACSVPELPLPDKGISAEDQKRLSEAIASGDASLLPADPAPLLTSVTNYIDTEKQKTTDFLQAIYGNSAISYAAGPHSQFVRFNKSEGGYPLIRGNKGNLLAAAVEIETQRNAAFGSNIIRSLEEGQQQDYQTPLINTLAWLLKRDSANLSEAAEVRLVMIDNTTAAKMTSWITTHFPNWLVQHCTEDATLTACASNAVDLVITGSAGSTNVETAKATLRSAQAIDAALLYVHLHDWNASALTTHVLAQMNLSMQSPGGPGNYFSNDAANWTHYQDMLAASWELEEVRQLVGNIQQDSFSFDLSACATNCDPAFANEFKKAVNNLRLSIQTLDVENRNIFAEEGYELEKMMILLGDTYRKNIVYPMDVASGDSKAFLQAYFADHTVYNSRSFNAAQPDLGNFSRSDFSHVTPTNKNVTLTSKKSFRSAGVYALPGQTFTVTRNDNSDLNVWVFINTQRSASTKEFGANQYKRPKFLQSPTFKLAAGETITVTSPYGGPLQVKFDKNGLDVDLSFNNIGRHAHWASAADNESFEQRLAAGDYDWAEVVTPNFEIHSQLDKMRASIANATWSSAAAMAAGTEEYIHNYPHVLAGFQGPGIDKVLEIHDFADTKGWTIVYQDIVKHMNADQPTCGSGCSGNPYDASWQFNPISHGDIHELGHGLEKSKLRFVGWDGHASTNPYSYYSKSQYHRLTNSASSCQSLPFEAMFSSLKNAMEQADPNVAMQNAGLTSWSQGMSIYVQMMMAAQAQGSLQDGWHLLARLHILLREFETADNSEESWLAKRNSLGFDQFSLAQAKALNNNDWLLIAISTVTERDYREFLMMWGLSFSAEATLQVASFGFAPIVKRFYQAQSNDYCLGLDKPAIDIIDSDGDGVLDAFDAFVNDPNESSDADGDGIGDNADTQYDLAPASLQYSDKEITSLNNNLCLGIDASTELLAQQLKTVACSLDANSQWSWSLNGQLHSKANYAFCITADRLSSGATLSLQHCTGDDKQKWGYDSQENSIRSLVNDAIAFDKYSNGNVNSYNFHGGSNQQWQVQQ